MKHITKSFLVFFIGITVISCSLESRPLNEPQGNTVTPDIEPIPTPVYPETPDPEFTIVGHRGAKLYYPQNTLPSFDYALSVEADQIEFDTQFTINNDIVINHDAWINADLCLDRNGKKIANKKLYIRKMTLEQFKQYDCGTLQKSGVPKYTAPGAKLPTLDELIQFVLSSKHPKAQTVVFKFDIKYEEKTPQYWPSPSEIARRIVDKVYAYGIQNRSEFSAFEPRILEEIYKIDPKLKLAYLVTLDINQKSLDRSLQLHVNTFSPNITGLTIKGLAKWTKKFQDAGIHMVPYTSNKESEWKKLLDAGAFGIITDDPEGLRAYYESRPLTDRADVENDDVVLEDFVLDLESINDER